MNSYIKITKIIYLQYGIHFVSVILNKIYFTLYFSHTNHRTFSLKGIQLVVDYFTMRGHIVKVFLPQYIRKREYTLLEKWYTKGIVVFTPSRKIGGRQITSHDDR